MTAFPSFLDTYATHLLAEAFICDEAQRRKETMSSSTLVRLCGLAIVASGALFVISILMLTYAELNPQESGVLNSFSSQIDLIAGPLEILGLVGLYTRRPQGMGIFGLIAFVVAFFGAV